MNELRPSSRIRCAVLLVVLALGMFCANPSSAQAADSETVVVPFINGPAGVTTTNFYSGLVTINVSGFGQAASTQYSDAFYIFTDSQGNLRTPEHIDVFGLWINDNPAAFYTPLPSYRADHHYIFDMMASSTKLKFKFADGDSFVADNTGQFIVTISPGSISLPPYADFKQRDLRWGQDPLAGSTCGVTIGQSGCALTSVADIIASYGTTQLSKGFGAPTPKTLNAWLQANGGYSGCLIYWGIAAQAAPGFVKQPQILYASSSSLTTRMNAIDGALSQGFLPIVMVNNRYGGSHYIVLTGKSGGSYSFLDPDGTSGSNLSAFYPAINDVIIYQPGAQSPARLSLRGHSPIQLLITAPNGQRTGYDALSGTYLQEIPLSSYGIDHAPGNDDGTLPNPPDAIGFDLAEPSAGTYDVKIFGTGDGAFTLDISTTSVNSDDQLLTLKGNVRLGDVHELQFSVDPNAIAPIRLLDTTPPTTTTVETPFPSAVGWNKSDVTISFTSVDNPSGSGVNEIDASFSGAKSGSQVLTGNTGATVVSTEGTTNVSYSAVDVAGNKESPKSLTVKLDKTPPVVTVTGVSSGASYLLGAVTTAACSTTDALSGVATNAALAVTGGSPGGVGTFTATCAGAVDNAGNQTAPVSATYTVAYKACTLYDQTKAAQSGSVIPIKLYLCDSTDKDVSSSGTLVHATGVALSSASITGPVSAAGNANPDNDFRFDSTLGPSGGYIYNLSTKGLSTGTYNLSFTASGDPTSHMVQFQVK